ncbi:MAG: adenosylcobinamide-GDP ribazoletransferase [Candidatus Pseudobacter hemicellulosilyticus]|uniref:Adenosylcobinamide-GDP ribazoletransferase n=1 Tax=Candidatus Pseudobacter hemicellulosilyticus TaxID=3121375 RepID=A0AAJ5WUP0_9BACT|nr:MAG: adenosylcobinamide-GDP ribazoletransferase [Pseudobacter sp.]
MKKEIRIFFTAMMFLTRLPVPHYTDHSQEYLERSAKYFPLIGWIVAAISGLTFLVFNKYISEDIAILASIIAGILTTGAFHEDGFADCCDAFGGGWNKEQILRIMKDSRLGTFGVIGLISVLAAKFLLLRELPKFSPDLANPTANPFLLYKDFLVLLIAAHGVSRLMGVLTIRFFDYVSDPEGSKSKPITSHKPGPGVLLVATAFAFIPFYWLGWPFLLAVLPVLLVGWNLARYFKRWIGGYTGDCLGAMQQVSELVFYLGALIIWRYVI